jgi:hypothetical protein
MTEMRKKGSKKTDKKPLVPYKPVAPSQEERAALEALFKRFPKLAGSLENLSSRVLHYGSPIQERFMEIVGAVLAGALKSEADLRELISVLKDAEQGARNGGTSGMGVSSDIFWRFAEVKNHFQAHLNAFFQDSPILEKMFAGLPGLGIRLLCLEDESLRYDMRHLTKDYETLIKTDEDALAFVKLMARSSQNPNVNGDPLLKVLPKAAKILLLKTGKAAFDFMLDLVKRGNYLHGVNEPEWLNKLRQQAKNLEKGTTSLKAVTRLKEYDWVAGYAEPWITSDADAGKVERAFKKLFAHHYGYSDLQADMEGMVGTVLEICSPKVTSLAEFIRLCREVPRIIEGLPRDGESTPLGWTHSFDTSDLKARVGSAGSLKDLLT